ncbi:MAG: tetratricopeptide repeat protein [Syntrophales bacterium]
MELNRKRIIVIVVLTVLLSGSLHFGSLAGSQPGAVGSGTGSGAVRSPEGADTVPRAEGYPLYKKAVDVFAGGRYAEARALFEQILQQQGLPTEITEDSWRRLADCTYFLASDDDPPSYHNALEYFNKVLAFYPDPRPGNDRIHLRLAKCYEKVKYTQAAVEHYRDVVTKYPDSPFLEEVFSGIGDIAEKEGTLERAVAEYRSYLLHNSDGKYARIASLMIGDCYYRMGQTVNAELWFRGALKKWPGVQNLPRRILRDLGFHNYQMKQFTEAISLFSLYLSLYPHDSNSPYVMYSLAHTLAEKDQIVSAMKVFQQTIDQYPGTREARDSAVSLIDLEAERARMRAKAPVVFLGYDSFRDPLMAYDQFLAKYPQGELTEYLLYRKGYALARGNRPGESVRAFDRLLSFNPKGRYSDLGRRHLKTAVALIVNGYAQSDNHLGVADLYYRSYGRHLQVGDDYRTCYRMARSLVELGLYADALVLLKELVPREKDPDRRDHLRLFMAEINRREGRDQDAEAILVGLAERGDTKNRELAARIKRDLASIYYRRGDWGKAVRMYGDIGSAGHAAMTVLDYQRYARALHISKNYAQALSNYRLSAKMAQDTPGRTSPQLLSDAYIGMGDSLYRENNFSDGVQMYQQARGGLQEQRDRWWVDLRIGQGYTRLNNPERGGKTFEEVKAAAAASDTFAVKMIDAWKADALWYEQSKGLWE